MVQSANFHSSNPTVSPQELVGESVNLPEDVKDYFVEKNGQRFAGIHLLLDFWGANNLTDKTTIEAALVEAATAAEATVLATNFRQFTESEGVSGVLVLAESHISIHTWPECSFAAIDIFMCGKCDPYRCVDVLKLAFEPAKVLVKEQRRGLEK